MDSRLTNRRTLRVFFIASVLIVAAFSLMPLIFTAIISTRKNTGFSPHFFGTSGAGSDFYEELFATRYLPRLLRNTAVLTLCPAIVTAAFTFLLIMAVSNLPDRICKTIALMLLAVPSFVPLSYLSGIFTQAFSYTGSATELLLSLGVLEKRVDIMTVKEYFIPIYILIETLRYMFFPVLLGVIALERRKAGKASAALKIALAYILVRISMAFITGDDLIMALYRPDTYEAADTFSTYLHRRSLLLGDYGSDAAFDIFRFALQLIINVGVFFGLKALFGSRNDMKEDTKKPENAGKRSKALISAVSIAVYIILASGAIFTAAPLIFPQLILKGSRLSFSGFKETENIGKYFLNSFIYAIPRAIVFAVLSFIIAYPLASRSRSVKALVLTALSAGGILTMIWLIFNRIGLLYTLFGTMLFGSFSCVGAVALALSLREKHTVAAPSFREYTAEAWRGVLVLFLLGFALNWNSVVYMYSGLWDKTLYPISVALSELYQFGSLYYNDMIESFSLNSGIALTASIPPVAAVWSVLLLRKKLPAGLLSAGFRV